MPHSRCRTAVRTVVRVVADILRLVVLGTRFRTQLAAEHLFLKKQLALYMEREVKPRRADDATRITLVALSWLIEWRCLLTVVSRIRSFDGIERPSSCGGGGNRRLAGGRDCQPTCSS